MTLRHVPSSEYAERIGKLMQWADEQNISGVLLTSPHSIYYYTGFETTGYYLPHVLIVIDHRTYLLVRDFEEGNDHDSSLSLVTWGTEAGYKPVLLSLIADLFDERRACAYDERSNFHRPDLLDALRDAFPQLKFVASGRSIDLLRRVKSEIELDCSRRAGLLAKLGLVAGLQHLKAGITERDVSLVMFDRLLGEKGEVPPSFPYTYFGNRSWSRMQQPGNVALRRDQTFYLECGATSGRYAAACLRTGAIGKIPDEVRDLHDAAVSCFQKLADTIRPGVVSGALDAMGAGLIRERGHEAIRLSKFGYSLGIAFTPGWGEAGVFEVDPHSSDVLDEGMVLHLVVTLMSRVWGTVGLSETMEVTREGCRSLTPLDRDLVELA